MNRFFVYDDDDEQIEHQLSREQIQRYCGGDVFYGRQLFNTVYPPPPNAD